MWRALPQFHDGSEGETRLKATFGNNFSRPATLKRKCDPQNLFGVNHNISPAM
ncbi:BBE domain-containing protein [Mesorhizobium sp. AR07]|uniref:BBE domain-containing protein n=1 Tax=Mesorhizobium sp. AR07 TaxID=2865838 RepID=UPI00215EADC7|nr:BBE domain-containing protein [Mesorhizobium sp. AR07]